MPSIAVKDLWVWFEDYTYRAPMKFRATVVDRVTLLNVEVRVEKESGECAAGFGSMPLGNVWAFPSATLGFDQTLEAMKQMALEFGEIVKSYDEREHPVEMNRQLEPLFFRAAGEMRIGESVPKLAALVVASAFDAAIHDGYGRSLGVSCYQTYGREQMKRDLSRYLDQSFRGDYLEHYISACPSEWLHVYHLVGALIPSP